MSVKILSCFCYNCGERITKNDEITIVNGSNGNNEIYHDDCFIAIMEAQNEQN